MGGDEPWVRLFDDLEQQAEGLALVERDLEVAEQARLEYATVDLAMRLHASVGRRVVVAVIGVGVLDGELLRVGDGWCLLGVGFREWVVRLAAVGSVQGLSEQGLGADARPVTARLRLTSALRGLADTRSAALVHRLDGSTLRGVLGRVGADFVEVSLDGCDGRTSGGGGGGGVRLLPVAALAAVGSV